MQRIVFALFIAGLLLTPSLARPELVPGSLDVHWNEGAEDCAASRQAPLQVHRYNARTFILRENLCATYEAPFMYLLIGSTRALLIDSGDVTEAQQMPLASTVMALLPGEATSKLPLVVVHTHGHLDHRSGDAQFVQMPRVDIVATDLQHVEKYFGFPDWPNGLAQLDLGERTVDVIPTPGHYPSHVAFYDRETGLFFSGDFFLPGRLIIDDADADIASAQRVAGFIANHPVSHVLGGHVELDADGETFAMGSQYHPREHPLQLGSQDLLALPDIVGSFNGCYSTHGVYVLYSQTRVLLALGAVLIVIVIAIAMGLGRYLRRRRRRRLAQAQLP